MPLKLLTATTYVEISLGVEVMENAIVSLQRTYRMNRFRKKERHPEHEQKWIFECITKF